MIACLSEKISSSFVAKGIVPQEEKEVYAYSFEILLATLLNLLAVCLLAASTRTILETGFYLLAFLPLRQIFGGYHAKSHMRCFLLLMAAYAGFIVLIKCFPYAHAGIAIFFFLATSIIVVFLLAPVADSNKPLSAQEARSFKRKSRIAIIACSIAIAFACLFIADMALAFSFTLGIMTVTLSLVAGKLKNIIIGHS